jgi:hypothetical protein
MTPTYESTIGCPLFPLGALPSDALAQTDTKAAVMFALHVTHEPGMLCYM